MTGLITNTYFWFFLIAAVGYLLGAITIKGVNLGTSGVLIMALVGGHFIKQLAGAAPADGEEPTEMYTKMMKVISNLGVIKNWGLAVFVGSVGMIAGPVFFRNFKNKVFAYLALGVLIIVLGCATTIVVGNVFGTHPAIAIGLLDGSLTTTPGLAAATDCLAGYTAGSSYIDPTMGLDKMVSTGYGVAYVFGVIGVVLFVQFLPRILKLDMQKAVAELAEKLHGVQAGGKPKRDPSTLKQLDSMGMVAFCITMTLGMALATVTIPLGGDLSFSLGTAGGPLFAGLIIAHFGRIGNISLTVPEKTLKILRELGLCMFLLGAGVDAGQDFVSILATNGVMLFVEGIIIVLVPIIVGTIVATKVFKLDLLSTLGSVCGGMTSTPALGTLIQATGSEDVGVSYAATYPFALIVITIASQFMAMLWAMPYPGVIAP